MELYRPQRIVVEQGVSDYPLTKRVLERFPEVPSETVEDFAPEIRRVASETDPIAAGKGVLVISRFRGQFLKKCPGTQGFVCCNYAVMNTATGCTLDCTYCILQDYLKNNPIIRIFANTDDLFAELQAAFSVSPDRLFRIGTGELTDSLALDPVTDFSREIVPFFARQKNANLELKTKTNHVENLLDLPHGGRTVVAWSVNPEGLIRSDEKGSASLEQRLDAAKRCHGAGYRVAFHFDPIVFDRGWEASYSPVVEALFEAVPAESIAWISLGGLRFPPELKEIMASRFPESRLLAGEFVPCPDNKFRYIRPIRVRGYRQMLSWIRSFGPRVPVYLCMESRDVWELVFKKVPVRIKNLAGIF
jgi:spore photoproduct lyase